MTDTKRQTELQVQQVMAKFTRPEELRLKLFEPVVETTNGETRVRASALVHYEPADPTVRCVASQRFPFVAPLGPIEKDDLRWYLEEFFRWPVGLFLERAQRIEQQLPALGRQLYEAALAGAAAHPVVIAWQSPGTTCPRQFSIEVDSALPVGCDAVQATAARKAACQLFTLPWELLHDGHSFLFQSAHPVGVRRRLPQPHPTTRHPSPLPIRVLLVSPRPEDEDASYIDHRASALPLVTALEHLGDLVDFTILAPPTKAALQETLAAAKSAGRPFHVIHFDGHGAYDRKHGSGGLCFEHPDDSAKLANRASDTVDAGELASLFTHHDIFLVFLDACQSAQAEQDITASVAGKLLEGGVASIVAMSHSVLVETARRFVGAFYERLAEGATVGQAMLAGQGALANDAFRGQTPGTGALKLVDWFVPVLYQEDCDPQLFCGLPAESPCGTLTTLRQGNLGKLPQTPQHYFIGRSRELLALERLLATERYAVVFGCAGEGKTTLAVEFARWMVRSGRFRRAAFLPLDNLPDARSAIDAVGQQLLGEGAKWSVAQFNELATARQHLESELDDEPTIIVCDNVESILPDQKGQMAVGGVPMADLASLCQLLLNAHRGTRLIFTTRVALPDPFDNAKAVISLGRLSHDDAVELVSSVMTQEKTLPPVADPGRTMDEVDDLIESVGCHARALTLLAREVAKHGVRATTGTIRQLMVKLHKQYPDDRERSLFASVELSLQRLTDETRNNVRVLAAFHSGASCVVVDQMLGESTDNSETVREMFAELVQVGLVQYIGYGVFRLDPALSSYLLTQMAPADQEEVRAQWAAQMLSLLGYLSVEQHKDAENAKRLALLEIPNLLALLEWCRERMSPGDLAIVADRIEMLLSPLVPPHVMARVTAVSQANAKMVHGWNHARFLIACNDIELSFKSGDLRSACNQAKRLLARCREAGPQAYQGAEYDLARAFGYHGRMLRYLQKPEQALVELGNAQDRFEKLAAAGDVDAARLASNCITDRADCLVDLGRLDDASDVYTEVILRYSELGDRRGAAVAMGQIGFIRMRQGQFTAALASHRDAKDLFQALGERLSVGIAWRAIGMVHRHTGRWDEAERAYRQALAIFVQEKNVLAEADTLDSLGLLYDNMGKREQGVTFCRNAAQKFCALGQRGREGNARSNASDMLIALRRYDEARTEIERAIQCKQPYGHSAYPWKTWNILHDLEVAAGNVPKAQSARKKAIQCFLAYRRDGGENREYGGPLCQFIGQAIENNETAMASERLGQMAASPGIAEWLEHLIPKLQSIVHGNRDRALAEDPRLYYTDAAELILILEKCS